jgi:hypothetical protein
MIEISKYTPDLILRSASNLKSGNLVAFPTETVYGLGADATNELAVSKIYSIKGRPSNHPLIVHISSANKMLNWAEKIPDYAHELANKYWKKRSYLFQGFVRQNPIGDDKTPANPIRRFIISPQIFTIIKASLMDPEMEELPTDFMRGLDLNIKKTSKGGYADYSTSNWARKESALTEAEQAAIEAHGLYNLAEFLPKRPGEAELRIIKEMFDASVDGQPYDLERWGSYYRPWGLEAPAGATAEKQTATTETRAPATAPVAETSAPWEEDAMAAAESIKVPTAQPSSDKAQDILAMIRARQNKS